MAGHDAWSNPSDVSAADATRMAAFLEERAAFPDQAEVNARLREALAPKPGERWLEVGSGSGVLCRLLVPDVTPGGHVTGLDISNDMVAAARGYALQQGVADSVSFDTGPAEALPYAEASFDGVFGARLLLHLPDPDTSVREMVRVVRPRGRVVLMDWDFDMLAVDHSQRELTRRIVHWRTDHHSGNNWSGRQLYGRLAAAGLGNLRVVPVVSIAQDGNAALTHSLWRAAEVALNGGAITRAEHDGWAGELRARVAAGRFFASIVYFIVRGER